ncbi:NAD(P)-dependent oxidoreductase (plasmid) [Salinigranum rubrum]|uniref:NAD(P)-dependent oxidoreductase n=1 Tax=Salinigranum rubrum TaxID=755307 RepID=A0A2I8VRZ9_9EURY|nr:NAD(P)-dependent oxidoreductase [Salinigranum rubrum]AUV84634.1 NAD(P)-dependent oxidoreductase [Salinigranum rubrum]
MKVLITGGAGTVGTAITDHLADRPAYSFTSLDLDDHSDSNVESVVADVAEYDAIRPHLNKKDAVVHLANTPLQTGHSRDRTIEWTEAHGKNIRIHANVMRAAVDAGVESVIWASSNHAVGMYEVANAPDIYFPDSDLIVDHTVQPRPDSVYGAEKLYGEGLGRLAAESHRVRFYALRICTVCDREYDHPFGHAEAGVDRGDWERDSDEYAMQVARIRGMWHSRRDHAHLVECCLEDDSVEFDVFYGVSDNDRRWFDIDHAREVLGYDPQDNGETWEAPPT